MRLHIELNDAAQQTPYSLGSISTEVVTVSKGNGRRLDPPKLSAGFAETFLLLDSTESPHTVPHLTGWLLSPDSRPQQAFSVLLLLKSVKETMDVHQSHGL